MQITIEQPVERMVTVKMTETQAKILRDLFDCISGGGKNNILLHIDNTDLHYNQSQVRETTDEFSDALEDLL